MSSQNFYDTAARKQMKTLTTLPKDKKKLPQDNKFTSSRGGGEVEGDGPRDIKEQWEKQTSISLM